MHASLATVMVADADDRSRHELCDSLEEGEFRVREVADGDRLLSELQREIPHLVLMDLELPSVGGVGLCRRIKRRADVPIIVLTALADERVKLEVLDRYAEDYILKPASQAEVIARVRCVLRRTWLSCPAVDHGMCVDDALTLDFLRREARTPRGVHRLTPTETRLLQLLVRNAGQVLPAELILERVWGDAQGSVASLWEYVRRVRQKIGDDAAKPRYVLNEPGLGYRFSSPGSSA